MNTAAGFSHQAGGIEPAQSQGRARARHLMGLLAHWPSLQGDPQRLGWTSGPQSGTHDGVSHHSEVMASHA